MPVRETGPNRARPQPARPFSRPKPNPDRRHSRDFGRQRVRDPAETASAAERRGFEPPVSFADRVAFFRREEAARRSIGIIPKRPIALYDRWFESPSLRR